MKKVLLYLALACTLWLGCLAENPKPTINQPHTNNISQLHYFEGILEKNTNIWGKHPKYAYKLVDFNKKKTIALIDISELISSTPIPQLISKHLTIEGFLLEDSKPHRLIVAARNIRRL